MALLAGCGSGSINPTVGAVPDAQSIEGVRWEPVANRGHQIDGAFLTFDDALNWHASDGCTEVRGNYEYFEKSGGRVTARQPDGDLRNTETGPRCPGVPTASALAAAAFLRLSHGRLLLVTSHDQVILRLEPADA